MNTTAAAPAGRSSRTRAYIWFGYAVSAACLIYVLHGFHVKRAIEQLADVSWRWVVLGIAFDIASYVVQALRWKLLLAPFGRVKMRDATRAVFAGLFANLIFPLRPGELLRSYLVSKAEDIGFVSVVGSVLVERLIDLVVTTAGLGVMLLIVSAPARFRHAANALGIVTLVLLGLFIAMILYIELRFGGDPRRMSGGKRMPGKLMSALIGLHAMGTSPSFYPAVFTSLLMPFCQVLALWALMRSYGMGLPFLAAVVVLLVINLGVSLPNAPANVGSYQFFCVLGLNIFEVEKNTAAGFSFFAFFMLTIPFLFLGFYAVICSGLSMRSMREQMSRLPSEARATQT
ncbi:MAG: lysylphosphatidylglycerol synthase transmembrane domain-containing protein [Candidatus Acidiferrales bacterium]